jgi:hypothetical protein
MLILAVAKNYCRLQYHKAAQIGRERAQKAQMRLFDYTGFAMLTYTIKQGMAGFEPVGEEELAGKMTRGNEAMLFICDKDGYAKAQSRLSKRCLLMVCKSLQARSRRCHRLHTRANLNSKIKRQTITPIVISHTVGSLSKIIPIRKNRCGIERPLHQHLPERL